MYGHRMLFQMMPLKGQMLERTTSTSVLHAMGEAFALLLRLPNKHD